MKIIECPRDAMQGLPDFIPTQAKADYINTLLKVGFDTIDFGSFVSPASIPQMRDTADVLSKLELSNTESKLLVIIANIRGAEDASRYDEINYLGFPFSISPTFSKRNINSTIEESVAVTEKFLTICDKNNKELVIYMSMGFGNPYGDEWNIDIVAKWTNVLHKMGIKIISLSDTIGKSTQDNIAYLFSNLIPAFSGIEFGFHLHTTVEQWYEKVDAAFNNGCKRFDAVINGLGGCPMAEDELVGNLKTENLIEYLQKNKVQYNIDESLFKKAMEKAIITFN